MRIERWSVLLLFIPLLAIFGCTSEQEIEVPKAVKSLENVTVHPPDTEPAGEILLEEEITYEDIEEVTRGRISGNVAVDSRGRVYIPDFQAKVVHAYNADGSYLDSIGREGKGPGEFQMIRTIRVADDTLHVLDYTFQKISVFDLQTMKHIHDMQLSISEDMHQSPPWLDWTRKKKLNYKPLDFYVRSDGNYLIFFGDMAISSVDNVSGRTYEVSLYDPIEKVYLKHDLLSFAWTGQTLIDQSRKGMTVMFRVPHKRGSRFAYTGSELIHGWTEEILIKIYDEEGEYKRAFYHRDPDIPLAVEDALAHYKDSGENVVRAIRNDTLPETWPAFDALKLDDEGRVWISTFTRDPHTSQWWVLDGADGTLLARFDWPRKKQIEQVKNGKLYTRETDEETGLQKIIRYDIKIK
ncbi:6-bladed beta-propeller protein [Fodinibius roseus]|uniref:6-bladed beta-propeller protein n=1 Tax=Fodinibius roseus TaxID=1194090 RepID=A0A1M4SE44_9BACT|nr:6-bladed beta-propeller [Fodinibius roseus]SHE30469.1 6-bladed beta-propeller protein [Fodinibius roseus]